MANFSFNIFEFVEDFNGNPYQINIIRILNEDNTFDDRAEPPFISVADGSLLIISFITRISQNKKEFIGFFTSDAFTPISGNATIRFGYGLKALDEFQNQNINAITEALPPLLSSLGAPMGDSVWLASVT